MTQRHSFLFLAPGFEEIEALATVDVLRRAGMAVSTVAVNGGSKFIKGAHGVTVEADLLAEDADFSAAEWLICPGGMPGATNLANSPVVSAALTTHFKRGGKIAAICASPAVVLEPLGILQGREATCYPGMEKMISSAKTKDAPVVISGNVVTGNGFRINNPFRPRNCQELKRQGSCRRSWLRTPFLPQHSRILLLTAPSPEGMKLKHYTFEGASAPSKVFCSDFTTF